MKTHQNFVICLPFILTVNSTVLQHLCTSLLVVVSFICRGLDWQDANTRCGSLVELKDRDILLTPGFRKLVSEQMGLLEVRTP